MSETTTSTTAVEKIDCNVNLSLRNAQGLEIKKTSVCLKATPGLLPIARSCASIILIQPPTARGSYAVYIGAEGGYANQLLGYFWAKTSTHEARMDVVNVSISATKAEGAGGGFTAVLNKNKLPVYQFTMVNADVAVPMANLIPSIKKFVHVAIEGSGLAPERVAEVIDVTVGSSAPTLDDLSVIASPFVG